MSDDKEVKPIVSFKGFDSKFQCRGFQYEVGKTYTMTGEIEACSRGFHACENPMDVFSYYLIGENGNLARFARVEQSGKTARHSDDSKIASAEITIKAELKLPDIIKAAVNWMLDSVKTDERVQAASGDSSQLAASGNSSQLAASGDSSQLAASGYSSQLAASGDSSQLAASGNYSQLAASGDSSQLAASGKNSVIAAASPHCTAIGADGTWISLAEFDSSGKCIGFATGQIGKDGLEPNVAYRAKGGKLVRVED